MANRKGPPTKVQKRKLRSAWDEISRRLDEVYLTADPTPIEFTPDDEFPPLSLDLGEFTLQRLCGEKFWIWSKEQKKGAASWYQVGDNVFDFMCTYGADPQDLLQAGLCLPKNEAAALDVIKIFDNRQFGERHWHYVGFGLSNLYGCSDQGDDADEEYEDDDTDEPRSYRNYELTIRIPNTGEMEPSYWAVDALGGIANAIVSNGLDLGNAAGYLKVGDLPDTTIKGFALAIDVQLGTVDSLSGPIDMVQLVGVTADELDWIEEHGTFPFLEKLSETNPAFLTRQMPGA